MKIIQKILKDLEFIPVENKDYFSDELYEVISSNKSIAKQSFQLIKQQNETELLPFFTTLKTGNFVQFMEK